MVGVFVPVVFPDAWKGVEVVDETGRRGGKGHSLVVRFDDTVRFGVEGVQAISGAVPGHRKSPDGDVPRGVDVGVAGALHRPGSTAC